MTSAARQLQVLWDAGSFSGLPDGVLLERFLEGAPETAEAAFEVLVERHGAMVRRTCRQITGDHHDAEDAAQATFLVLARRARSVRSADSLAAWLHGVARRVSAKANADAARRRSREQRAAERAGQSAGVTAHEPDPWPEIHEELARLPARYRPPIVLCHLEGLSHEQAARQLGCPVRTLQTRLARGRARLRSRLARRGLGPAAEPLAAPPLETVSAAWAKANAQASARFVAARGASIPNSIPDSITKLAGGALRDMTLMKLKLAAAVVLAALVAGGVGGLAQQAAPPPDDPSAPAAAPNPTTNPYLRTTQGGGTIEVVAVSRWPSSPKSWWRPDGTPMENPPADAPDGAPPELPDPGAPRPDPDAVDGLYSVFLGQKESLSFVLAIRCDKTTGLAFLRLLELEVPVGARETERLYSFSPRDRPPSDRPVARALPPPGLETGEFRFGVASVPWTTQGSFKVRPDWTFGVAEMGSKLGRIVLSPPRRREAEGKEAEQTVFVTVRVIEQRAFARFVAIDRQGNTREPSSRSGLQLDQNAWMTEYYYDLPREDIKEIQFQARPIELLEIPDIALAPPPAE